MRITKQCNDARDQYMWLKSIPKCAPKNLLLVKGNTIEYDFIDGHHPRDWKDVHDEMIGIWHHGINKRLDMDGDSYIEYVVKRAIELGLERKRIEKALSCIVKDPLTQVTFCHGDLTLYNVLKTQDGIVLIDPGNPRGLPCQEIDEAKIMQSLDGFDCVYRNLPQANIVPTFPARKVHWALLLSHYIRMLRHIERHRAACNFAKQRIRQLTGLLT
jgi:hypothetical protein